MDKLESGSFLHKKNMFPSTFFPSQSKDIIFSKIQSHPKSTWVPTDFLASRNRETHGGF